MQPGGEDTGSFPLEQRPGMILDPWQNGQGTLLKTVGFADILHLPAGNGAGCRFREHMP